IDDARAWTAVLLIAVPWETMIDWMLFLPFVPVCALLLVWSKWRSTPATLIACSIAFLSLAWRLHLAQVAVADHTMLLVPLIPAPPVGAGADVSWAMWNRFAPVLPFLWAEKALTVAGFGLLLATALKAASPAPARAIS
ncbi:MAG: hypothetical protein M3R35_05880, partial [Candidatus Eremiobacteraeota bacterium]|nr:hypothetical protein [Candidatus Eremiobacteraeota bacterium]